MIVVLKHSRTFPRQEKWWPWTSGWILCMFLSWHLQMFLIRLFSAEKRLKSLRSRRISHLCFSGKAYSQRKCVNGDNSPFFGGWNEFRERSIYFSESRSSAAPQDASGCCSFSPDNGSAVQKYLEFFLSFSTVQSLKFTKKIPKRQHFLGMTEWLAPNKKTTDPSSSSVPKFHMVSVILFIISHNREVSAHSAMADWISLPLNICYK